MTTQGFFRKHAVLLTLLFVLAVMTMIFCFSSQKAEASNRTSGGIVSLMLSILFPGFESMEPERQRLIADWTARIIRKTAHFTEYALLGTSLYLHVLAWMARREIRRPRLLSLLIGALYAASDELHQTFVSGRSGEVLDVLLDSAGVLFGIFLLWWILHLIHKRRARKI
ncbi:MAG: VanZ family protein [Oscillospiraceae bacterium]|nr:VanZ family protein [Oscillospiraceae bacterium]